MRCLRIIWRSAVLLLLATGAAASDLSLSSLAQQGKFHEIIRELRPRVEGGQPVSSFQLLLLGGAYYEARRYSDAIAVADLMAKRVESGDRSYFGADLSVYPQVFRALVALDQGAYEEAIKLAAGALDRLKPNQSFHRHQLIQVNNVLGMAHAILGRADAARTHLARIREVSVSASNLGPEKFTALARIHMALKEYDKALASIDDRDAEVSSTLRLFYDPTFQDLPRFFIRHKSQFETRQLKEAKQGYDQLLKHPQIAQFGGIYWVVLYDRARIALEDGDAARAIELLRKAVDIIEQQRSSIDTEAGRIGFVGDKQAVYQTLVSLLLANGHDAAAFEYVERSKARALVDLLASQRTFAARTPHGDTAATLQKLAKTESELVALPAPDDVAGAARTRSVAVEFLGQLRSQAPELAALVSVTSTPAQAIQALLQPGEALLEYYYTERELVAFVMTGDAIKAIKLERAGLEEGVAKFRECIAYPDSGGCAEQAQGLYDRLFRPAAKLLQTKRLVIVPHGALHYLPFNALHSGSSHLIDDYSMRVEPSAGVLELLKSREGKAYSGALVLGNPDLGKAEFDLKHAEEEAVAIAKLIPGSRVLLRESATRKLVRSEGERYGILHFATHGVFDLREPLNSALLLAPDRESDGRLTVSDLYALRLGADLVTLSACETALGRLSNGDDVVGFTRGLLYAGANSIVSSLWSVDDLATRDLMVSFYSNLPALGKQEALRQAQLGVKRQRQHPFFWAAFVLTGQAD